MEETIRDIAAKLDATVEAALEGRDSFRELAVAAGLDPARDFRGRDLAGVDLRDEDLSGFDFAGADLTGCDFRRATGLSAESFDGALVAGCIGLPLPVLCRRDREGRIGPAEDFHAGMPPDHRRDALEQAYEVRLEDGGLVLATVAPAGRGGAAGWLAEDGSRIPGSRVRGWRHPLPEVSPGLTPF